jgi:hypothetical protein
MVVCLIGRDFSRLSRNEWAAITLTLSTDATTAAARLARLSPLSRSRGSFAQARGVNDDVRNRSAGDSVTSTTRSRPAWILLALVHIVLHPPISVAGVLDGQTDSHDLPWR